MERREEGRRERREARRETKDKNTEAGSRMDDAEIESLLKLLSSGDLELSFPPVDGVEVPPLRTHGAYLRLASPDVMEPLLNANSDLTTLTICQMTTLAVLPKREFDFRNVLKALPVVHKYNLHVLLMEMVEWLTRSSNDDSDDELVEDEYEDEDAEFAEFATYYKNELSYFLGVDDKDPGSYALTWLRMAEKLQLEDLHIICVSFIDRALTKLLKQVGEQSEVEKWLLRPEADLTVIKPALLVALGNVRDDGRLWIGENTWGDEPSTDVVRWAKLGDSVNMPEVKAICCKWLEGNLEEHLTASVIKKHRECFTWVLAENEVLRIEMRVRDVETKEAKEKWAREKGEREKEVEAKTASLASKEEELVQREKEVEANTASFAGKEETLVQREKEVEEKEVKAKTASLKSKEIELVQRERVVGNKENNTRNQRIQLKANAAKELSDVRQEALAQLDAVQEACKACGVPAEKLDACIAKFCNARVLEKQAALQAAQKRQRPN
eukprot:gene27103-2327_t